MSRYRIIQHTDYDWFTWNLHGDSKYYTIEERKKTILGVFNWLVAGFKGDCMTWVPVGVGPMEFSTEEEARNAVRRLEQGEKLREYEDNSVVEKLKFRK